MASDPLTSLMRPILLDFHDVIFYIATFLFFFSFIHIGTSSWFSTNALLHQGSIRIPLQLQFLAFLSYGWETRVAGTHWKHSSRLSLDWRNHSDTDRDWSLLMLKYGISLNDVLSLYHLAVLLYLILSNFNFPHCLNDKRGL